MEIDYALILCAGFGTRMGPIGEVLPKPLWPIFEKTLLELQIKFAKELGAKKIFINIHHQAELFKDIKEENVELVFEPEILGTGGAIHNIASRDDVNYHGNFLYLAADQFYFFAERFLKEGLDLVCDHVVTLFGLEIPKGSPYSQLAIEDGLLKRIKGPREEAGITFSGMALVNLAKLKKEKGFSGFFESVCKYEAADIPVVIPEGEYIDWGNVANYFSGMFDLLEGRPKIFYEFCQSFGAFDSVKINLEENSYGATSKNLINLTSREVDNTSGEKAIVLKEGIKSLAKSGIYFEKIIHELPL
ncbi:MAG: hypothetical protein DRQ88_02545 [Epsilonproteobacteria bacterium]|nr:MAG: hypothetical protein DRQ89_02310 [Campylobacterota bacterium]RLA67547.1 MAG: hypothetical protein DRQ88_02545 [Campylobacterota bacterium]